MIRKDSYCLKLGFGITFLHVNKKIKFYNFYCYKATSLLHHENEVLYQDLT